MSLLFEAPIAAIAGAAAAVARTPFDASAWSSAEPSSSASAAAAFALPRLLWLGALGAAMALLGQLVLLLGPLCAGRARVPSRGKPLAEFGAWDRAFIAANQCITAVFVYHTVRYCCLGAGLGAPPQGVAVRLTGPALDLGADLPPALAARALAALTALPAPAAAAARGAASCAYALACALALFLLYDVFYTPFHLALHDRRVYALVHKHHHRSAAPHRGSLDAVNVHPLEFALGEYNHLWTAHLVGLALRAAGLPPLHAGAVLLFVALGGVLASLNHTRFDVGVGGAGPAALFRVAWHDVHHHRFAFNYGQYTMWVDKLLGTFSDAPEGEAGAGTGTGTGAAEEPGAGAAAKRGARKAAPARRRSVAPIK